MVPTSNRIAEECLPSDGYSDRLTKHNFKAIGALWEVTLMSGNPWETIERLERLAAWHRINAERAGADWVWEARLRTAEDLEREAAKIRTQLADGRMTAQS